MDGQFKIPATDKTPSIIFHDGFLEIKGRGLLEEHIGFWADAIKAIKENIIDNVNPLVTDFKIKLELEYLNSASSAAILSIMRMFENYPVPVKVLWHYEWDDEDMKEFGEDYEALVDLPFEFFSKES